MPVCTSQPSSQEAFTSGPLQGLAASAVARAMTPPVYPALAGWIERRRASKLTLRPASAGSCWKSSMQSPEWLTSETFGVEAFKVALLACLAGGNTMLVMAVRRANIVMASWR